MAAFPGLRQTFCFVGKFLKLFLQLKRTTFDALPLEKRLVDRLRDLNITTPTEIQQKSLGAILKGNNVIINAETGSGKTLCYLIPVLNDFLKLWPKKPGPSAVILVPNMDLGYQVTELFNKLSDPGFFACPVHQDTQLRINQKYPVIVSTPHALLQYNARSLSMVKTVVIDEADLIIANGRRTVWKLLHSFKKHWGLREHCNSSGSKPIQFVFSAATIPQRGEKSVFRKIMNWVPDAVHIKSPMVHQFVPTLQSLDIFMDEEEKLPQLLRCLNVLSGNLLNSDGIDSMSCEERGNLLTLSQNRQLRILVFANTVVMARNVFEFLNCEEGELFVVCDKKPRSAEKDYVCQHKITWGHVESRVSNKTKALVKMFSTKTGTTFPWKGKVGLLQKEVPMLERQELLKKFKKSEIVVLVSTNLASRGLDILDISHVIQLDYANNAADVLHRAGRTARAGAKGTVISFVTPKDQNLFRAIKLSKKGPETEGFQELFSRNRMFSRRIKRKL